MKWKTRNGDVINIKEMTFQHLVNAEARLEKTNRVILHEDLDNVYDNVGVDFQYENPTYRAICKEIESRRMEYVDSILLNQEPT